MDTEFETSDRTGEVALSCGIDSQVRTAAEGPAESGGGAEGKLETSQLYFTEANTSEFGGLSGLEWLLSPLSTDKFLNEFWERSPYVIQRDDKDYCDGLFAASDLDGVLEFCRPIPPNLRVVMQGVGVSSSAYLQSDGRLDLNQLRRLYSEGHTIIVNGLHRFSAPVAAFTQELQAQLSFQVLPNAYLTPAGKSRGLDVHYDTHDVFVVQLSGCKRWHLYCEAEAFPLLGSLCEDLVPRDELPPARVVELQAGDALYIPRGWIHEAETLDQSSLHLTFGVHPPQWCDFLKKALSDLTMRHERLRRALPPGYLKDEAIVSTLSTELRELAGLLEREGSASEALSLLQDDFIRVGRGIPDGTFVASLDRLESIDLSTLVEKRPHVRCRVTESHESAALQFARSVVQGPADLKEAMRFVAESRAAFKVSDLPISDEKRRISLVQRLVRDGLLGFAKSS